ncbi:MAG: hypothetical protein K0S53_1906 [Bacteroidetes bacterium]|jgi:hypothetical protein|nr:hypothetical protein [Bacteroidota bacterium]
MKQAFKDTFKVLDDINTREASKESKQARGRAFEGLLLDVFEAEEILQKRNRHTKDNRSEEIDGVIEVYNRIFLIEAKWVTSGLAASVLYSFIGKIENKFHGTLGVFISRNALKKNFLRALNKGRRQSVIVIHGKDVDLLFEGDVTFEEYIEYAFKELSSENIVHLPVEEYIKVRGSKESAKVLIEKVESSDKKGIQFVKEKLLAEPLSASDIIIELAALGREEKEKAYFFIVQNFSELWYANLTGDKTFIIKNMYQFLEAHKPSSNTLNVLAPEYYTTLVFKSIILYTRDIFIAEFKEHYSQLDSDVKNKFESLIIKYWHDNFGSYAVENSITDLLIPIWGELSQNLTNQLYKGYLDIFVSDRKNNHSQKLFAIELVEEKQIPEKVVKEWLRTKLRASGRMYLTLNTEKVAFIVSTYKGILKLVEPDENKWPRYVLDTLYESRTCNETDNSFTLTGNEKLHIVSVQGSKKENLLVTNISISHTYFSKDGSIKRYVINLVSDLVDPANLINNQILPVGKIFENGSNSKTEITFENLGKIELKVFFRMIH